MSEAGWASLEALEAHLWRRLARAAAEAADPWRFPQIATTGADGPQLRTVGLRRAGGGTLEVHADARTLKVAELRHDPRAQLLFWDAGTQEQLRVSVEMRVEVGDPERWARVPPAGRVNYGTDPAPGTPIDGPEAYARTPECARHAALVGRVRGMDAVWLAPAVHRRAIRNAGGWRWVAP
ncbi:pyridoxamine 5'-phosphate oxidase family protein [Jannaschia sp. W003]|uniref:pyridoxamine 5'-phosphate oxidase family protein n=1 Tax=Jannaschia sp. W003 TaxID=2867012 RepID=UPI0021A6CDAB|nr:pyridoxamine 5'-phosphate oxidase family protein [Jannaschia sp. W003]UWQ22468.1 pyridoxamine 5'-phosphate oxidase family protein [Jannaschia sp. W003]